MKGDNEDNAFDAVMLLRVVVILQLPVSMEKEFKATMPFLQSPIRNRFTIIKHLSQSHRPLQWYHGSSFQ
jgi:hypothetical protein